MSIRKEVWGKSPEGKDVHKFTMTNSMGASVSVIEWGAITVSIIVPDAGGNMDDVALGFDSLEKYIGPHGCFGDTVGRCHIRGPHVIGVAVPGKPACHHRPGGRIEIIPVTGAVLDPALDFGLIADIEPVSVGELLPAVSEVIDADAAGGEVGLSVVVHAAVRGLPDTIVIIELSVDPARDSHTCRITIHPGSLP